MIALVAFILLGGTANVLPTVGVCELKRDPTSYVGKLISTSASLVIDERHGNALLGDGCGLAIQVRSGTPAAAAIRSVEDAMNGTTYLRKHGRHAPTVYLDLTLSAVVTGTMVCRRSDAPPCHFDVTEVRKISYPSEFKNLD